MTDTLITAQFPDDPTRIDLVALEEQMQAVRDLAVRRIYFHGLERALQNMPQISHVHASFHMRNHYIGLRTQADHKAYMGNIGRRKQKGEQAQLDFDFHAQMFPTMEHLNRMAGAPAKEIDNTLMRVFGLAYPTGPTSGSMAGKSEDEFVLRLERDMALGLCHVAVRDPHFCLGRDGQTRELQARLLAEHAPQATGRRAARL